MFELNKIKNNTYFIENRTNIGIYKINDTEVILIDSGLEKDFAKKIKTILDDNNLKIKYIYNTHFHADHIGGNNYLQKEYNCKIFNNPIENEFVNNPIFEPCFMYGANPPKELKHKIIFAKPSISESLNELNIHEDIKIINLPGHTLNMCGFLTKDNVAFLGDALIDSDTLKKYPIAYIHNVGQHLKTLDFLKTLEADFYVPSHTKVYENISELIEINIKSILTVKNDILKICEQEVTFDTLLQQLFNLYNLELSIFQNYVAGSTVKAYITYLFETKELTYEIKNNLLYYKKC